MLRSGWSLKSTAIAIDVGPYGEGHQHEDKLSIQVWSHGKDLIGEAGLVDYAKSTKREYSLGTLAHSSAIIDGQQQNRARQFKEGARPLDTLVKATYDLESDTPWIKAAYKDGYGPKNEVAVVHEREVLLNSADLITVTDRFHADDAALHVVEVLFHLLKDTFEINGNECRTTGDGPNIILRCKSDGARAFAVSGVCGGTKPDLRGWAAMDPVDFQGTYKLVPRPCITITAAMSSKIKIITEIEIVA